MENPNSVSEQDRKTIERLHKNNAHKFNIPTYRRDGKKPNVPVWIPI